MKIDNVSFHIMGDNMDQIGVAVNGDMLNADQINRLVTLLNNGMFIQMAIKHLLETDKHILGGN